MRAVSPLLALPLVALSLMGCEVEDFAVRARFYCASSSECLPGWFCVENTCQQSPGPEVGPPDADPGPDADPDIDADPRADAEPDAEPGSDASPPPDGGPPDAEIPPECEEALPALGEDGLFEPIRSDDEDPRVQRYLAEISLEPGASVRPACEAVGDHQRLVELVAPVTGLYVLRLLADEAELPAVLSVWTGCDADAEPLGCGMTEGEGNPASIARVAVPLVAGERVFVILQSVEGDPAEGSLLLRLRVDERLCHVDDPACLAGERCFPVLEDLSPDLGLCQSAGAPVIEALEASRAPTTGLWRLETTVRDEDGNQDALVLSARTAEGDPVLFEGGRRSFVVFPELLARQEGGVVAEQRFVGRLPLDHAAVALLTVSALDQTGLTSDPRQVGVQGPDALEPGAPCAPSGLPTLCPEEQLCAFSPVQGQTICQPGPELCNAQDGYRNLNDFADPSTPFRFATSVNTQLGVNRGTGSCAAGAIAREIVLLFVPSAGGRWRFEARSEDGFADPILTVRPDCTWGGRPDIACNDNFPGLGSTARVEADLEAGVPVYLFVDAAGVFNGNTGVSAEWIAGQRADFEAGFYRFNGAAATVAMEVEGIELGELPEGIAFTAFTTIGGRRLPFTSEDGRAERFVPFQRLQALNDGRYRGWASGFYQGAFGRPVTDVIARPVYGRFEGPVGLGVPLDLDPERPALAQGAICDPLGALDECAIGRCTPVRAGGLANATCGPILDVCPDEWPVDDLERRADPQGNPIWVGAGNTRGAANHGVGICDDRNFDLSAGDAIFRFTPPGQVAARYTVRARPGGPDPMNPLIHITRRCAYPSRVWTEEAVACHDDLAAPLDLRGVVTVELPGGVPVYLFVDGHDGDEGTFEVEVSASRPPVITEIITAGYNVANRGVGVALTGQDPDADAEALRITLLGEGGAVVAGIEDQLVKPWRLRHDPANGTFEAWYSTVLPAGAGRPELIQVEVVDTGGNRSGVRALALSPPPVVAAGDVCDPDRGFGECRPGERCLEGDQALPNCEPRQVSCPDAWGVEDLPEIQENLWRTPVASLPGLVTGSPPGCARGAGAGHVWRLEAEEAGPYQFLVRSLQGRAPTVSVRAACPYSGVQVPEEELNCAVGPGDGRPANLILNAGDEVFFVVHGDAGAVFELTVTRTP